MAYIDNVTCSICGETKREVVGCEGVCNACRSAEKNKNRRIFLASLTGLTAEERLVRLESMLYDLNLDSRLRTLESYTLPIG